MNCPCQSNKKFSDCCAPYLNFSRPAPTPETVMRSRYTAYSLANIDYIAKTQIAPAADHFDFTSALQWAKRCKWLGLEVHRAWMDPNNSARGYVEFTAHFKMQGKKEKIVETSEFELRAGCWYYKNKTSSTRV